MAGKPTAACWDQHLLEAGSTMTSVLGEDRRQVRPLQPVVSVEMDELTHSFGVTRGEQHVVSLEVTSRVSLSEPLMRE